MTLADLHDVIQTAMGWYNCHLHVFEIGGEQYGDPSQMDDCQSEARLTLQKLQNSGVTRFAYTYDFGDSWDHTITIEKNVAPPEGGVLPVCIAGKRACPPEDCGGAWGYAELIEIMATPGHPEREQRAEWVGEINPEAFSLERVNKSLATDFRSHRKKSAAA
jgi:hypothetical protein